MTRAMHRWPTTDGEFDGGRCPGVFVIDADNTRRLATVRLLSRRPEIRVVGDHCGSPGVLAEAIRALPHVCVVGPRVAAGQPPQLIEALERALPASRCIRAPKIVGADHAVLSVAQRLHLEIDLDTFVDHVLAAAGLPAAVGG